MKYNQADIATLTSSSPYNRLATDVHRPIFHLDHQPMPHSLSPESSSSSSSPSIINPSLSNGPRVGSFSFNRENITMSCGRKATIGIGGDIPIPEGMMTPDGIKWVGGSANGMVSPNMGGGGGGEGAVQEDDDEGEFETGSRWPERVKLPRRGDSDESGKMGAVPMVDTGDAIILQGLGLQPAGEINGAHVNQRNNSSSNISDGYPFPNMSRSDYNLPNSPPPPNSSSHTQDTTSNIPLESPNIDLHEPVPFPTGIAGSTTTRPHPLLQQLSNPAVPGLPGLF